MSNIESNTLKMILIEKPTTLNARILARLYFNRFQCRLDYHEFSNLLDQWHMNGIVELTGHDASGMCQYKMKG